MTLLEISNCFFAIKKWSITFLLLPRLSPLFSSFIYTSTLEANPKPSIFFGGPSVSLPTDWAP